MNVEAVRSRLASVGLDAVAMPAKQAEGAPDGARALVLAVGAPARMWDLFRSSPERADGAAHPLDRWSRRVVDLAARDLGARALYPFEGPPYWPFLSWAAQAGAVWRSPIGLSVHESYGLWFSCRGALVFDEDLNCPESNPRPSPCLACEGRPCATACPVDAFLSGTYDVAVCAAHLRSPEGAECLDGGCLARRACPVGAAHAHAPERAGFHMRAFLGNWAPRP